MDCKILRLRFTTLRFASLTDVVLLKSHLFEML